jgi:hypothetical protein
VEAPLSTEGYQQVSPTLIADGAGGAFVAFVDHRSGEPALVITRLDASGRTAAGWSPLGSLAAPAGRWPEDPQLVPTRSGKPILIWIDQRHGSRDVFAEEAVAGPPAGPRLLGVGWPTPSALAIEQVRPNPARGQFWVRLSLPVSAATTLDLMDVAGRVVESRKVDLGRPAYGSIALNETGRLKPGVYWLRATQKSGAATSRIVIMP